MRIRKNVDERTKEVKRKGKKWENSVTGKAVRITKNKIKKDNKNRCRKLGIAQRERIPTKINEQLKKKFTKRMRKKER